MLQKFHMLVVFVLLTLNVVCQIQGQDSEKIKALVLKSIERFENIPTMVVKGKFESPSYESETLFYARGDELWQEKTNEFHKNLGTSKAEQAKEREENQRIMGCTLPKILAFDGKTNYEFSPSQLTLRVEPSQDSGGDPAFASMKPQQWVAFGQNKLSTFRKFIERKTPELSVQPFGDGQWKLSRSFSSESKTHCIVKPLYDYHVSAFEQIRNGTNYASGQLEWAKQDGFWYVKHGKHFYGKQLYCEWQISEISFDVTKCRNRFDDIESVVPFGTKITVYDSNRKISAERFKGGKPGEN